MIRSRYAVACLAAVFALGATASAQESRAKALTAADYVEIQQLYVTYAQAIDTKADGGMVYARTFTTDGELYHAHSQKTYRGHEQIAHESMGPVMKPSPVPTHYNANILIEPALEGARGGAYLLVMRGGPGAKPEVSTIGTYRDVIVRTSDGWRFKRRELYLNGMPPATDAAAGKK